MRLLETGIAEKVELVKVHFLRANSANCNSVYLTFTSASSARDQIPRQIAQLIRPHTTSSFEMGLYSTTGIVAMDFVDQEMVGHRMSRPIYCY